MKILITGAGGFLGKGIIVPFECAKVDLRLMDVVDFETPHEKIIGSVEDPELVKKAVAGCDGIIVAHMAGRGNDNYATPHVPFDVNVKGTANLFHYALEAGIKRGVLISSEAACRLPGRKSYPHTLPPQYGQDIYGLTKVLQEKVAEHFAFKHGMEIASLRVGYILDGDNNLDKYGRVIDGRNYADTDRRDIGEVALRCLKLDDLQYEVFHVMSAPEAGDLWDVKYTRERLDWTPEYDFTWLPLPGGVN